MIQKNLILVVDDDPDSCQILNDFFQSLNYRVQTAEDGQEGLQKFFDLKPCLVVLDVRMPIMDGYQMLKRIRELDSATPVIIVSAQSYLDGADECMKQGATDVLHKPIELDQLEKKVTRYLEK
ncbi:conserved hypothetical protein [Nitrospina gracilis 3/211]|uniref:Response regulatory domain-containing protein n=1 Tax=Nitrospina gracilis (strain 3/211) TaxID=1266370 RepID=M1Z0K9_NITG3|nr:MULTISPECIES: response regulator [Nitrospina]MCF8724103.1 DNA-binding NtrC family response regulator [Nitrospina sp. Nb-3]CCQ91245.1 conserved hypothetical protein [Nitrospina gracilis 3/211]